MLIICFVNLQLDENAKKVVESTHVAASSCVKQYLKWMEKINSEDDETKQKSSGGLFSSLKKALSRDSVEREVEVRFDRVCMCYVLCFIISLLRRLLKRNKQKW